MKRLGLFALVAITACFSDILVAPEANLEPLLAVSAEVLLDQQRHVGIVAILRRGTDSRGNPRSLTDSTIVVDGTAVQPSEAGGPILRWRREAAETVVGSLDTVELRGPILAGYSSPDPVLSFVIPGRVDPYVIEMTEGEDLKLNVFPFANTSAVIWQTRFWRLDVQEADGGNQRLTVDGRGAAPSSFTLPASLLSTQEGDSLVANFSIVASPDTVVNPYEVSAFLSVRVVWHIRIVAP